MRVTCRDFHKVHWPEHCRTKNSDCSEMHTVLDTGVTRAGKNLGFVEKVLRF